MYKINDLVIAVCTLLIGTHLSAQQRSNFGAVPLYFEENRGQTDAQAQYIARASGLVGFVLHDGWTLSLNGRPVSMHIAGADSKAALVPEGSVEGITNYYLGTRAITALPHYSSVRSKNIRPGIDVVYHGNQRELEYDLAIRPGADVNALRLRFEGSRPVLADNGDIVLKTSAGEVRQHKPRVWQEAHGHRIAVECRYALLESGEVGFVLSNYDRSAELIVDPIVSYSTYLGGTTSDTIAGIAADSSGYAFITGSTLSPDFPVTNGTTYQGSQDMFVTKLNPSGTGLVYSTFIGGTGEDTARAIALDNAGNAYVTGSVAANQFPPVAHAFVLKLGATGNMVYSTALAGNNSDSGLAIAVDASGSAYVTGSTGSTTFPVTPGAYKTTAPGGGDAFVAKLSANGQISYSTYLGGSANDGAAAIAVDAAGNAYVGGFTSSSNFPTTPGAYATASAGGDDGFVVKLNPTGSALVYATYLGGASPDAVFGLAVDAAGNCYVTGNTLSSNFPTTPGAFSTSKGSPAFGSSAFVTKLNATGTALSYSTFLGGNVYDYGVGIAVDTAGFAYVAGSTQSTNFPVTAGALKTAAVSPADYDMFLTKVALDGTSLAYSTLLGSSDTESAVGIALDGNGAAYIAGSSHGVLYPTTAGAFQMTNPKASSQFGTTAPVVTKIDLSSPTLCNPSVSPTSQNVPGHGDAISFNLTLAPGCPWEAVVSGSGSLTIDAPTHGVVSVSPTSITGTVPTNPNGFAVTELVRIGAATFTVNQGAGSCQDPVVTPQSVTMISFGEEKFISLMLPSSCAWTAVSGAPWLNVYFNPSGVGPATIGISSGGNVFSQRTTTLTIAGKSITVTQLGSTCTATASISTSSTSAQGGDGIVAITPNSSACYWAAYSLAPWIKLKSIGSGASGQGTGFVPFIFAENPTAAPRTGQILIADITLSFTQDAGPIGTGAFCTYSVSQPPQIPAAGGSLPISVTTTAGCRWSALALPAWLSPVNGNTRVGSDTLAFIVSPNSGAARTATIAVAGFSVDITQAGAPTLSVSHSSLNFASVNGVTTSPQTVTVNFTGGAGVAWTATSNQPNIVVLQGSGNGNGSFQVSASSGPSGIVTVSAPGAIGSPKQVQVNISTPSLGNPFGSFDTPLDNTSGVAGSVPVTGWALDAVEVVKVDIWREPVGGEPPGVLIPIGDAVFVEGARPDVEALNPNVPFNYRAGWGYQMLTNFLPAGNGTFKLHAIAHNKAGNSTDLGTKTIVVDNAHASKPFGTIDTPTQGGTASGNAYVNFGWALTQNPNKIPIDGSTITVVIDGQPVGHPTYNQFRSDIATLFPGYMNSGGAVGFFYIDTTKLTNGVHTISWNVFDNAGHGDGIGSRYFNVFNSGGGSAAEPEGPLPTVAARKNTTTKRVTARAKPVTEPRPQGAVPRTVEIEEVGQLELPLDAISGYQLVNGEHRPLPIGSSLNRGVFYWQPGPGFLGEYHLVFESQDGTEIHIHVKIMPKTYPPGI